MVIRKEDRVSTVLAADESLIEVFVGVSRAFERLRNPAMRKVMSRLVTVEQAARVGGVDADELVARLNAGAARGDTAAVARPRDGEAEASAVAARDAVPAIPPPELPAALAAMPETSVVEVDVREDLRNGREPFSRIMAARREVPAGGALRVRAIFEPVPLYAVMGKQGFAHHTEKLGEEDWRVWFHAGEAGPDASPAAGAAPSPDAQPREAGETDASAGVVVLDVRGLEPPEPMVRTLAALEELPPGATLVQVNVRVPRFLLPQLEERGFLYEIREQAPDLVRVFIRRAAVSPPRTINPGTWRNRTMSDQRTLDVRVIPPREKHPTIFQTFAALDPGESFVLVNDHDPKPLRYQFEYEHTGEFGWEYLEQGPAVWRVEISRKEA